MTDLTVFNFQSQQIRTLVIDGEPWFSLADVCAALGLGNPSAVASRLDEDALISNEVIDSLARPQLARSAAQVKERLDKGVRKTYPIFANRFLEAVA